MFFHVAWFLKSKLQKRMMNHSMILHRRVCYFKHRVIFRIDYCPLKKYPLGKINYPDQVIFVNPGLIYWGS
ncbi:MAG: hypothetical protein AMS26_07215 [Bacteroides sp. SM23_62]|nr:MAG: hypothetical protein AMS26_07215 [Bacteroides sp. SM23_62]